MRVVQETPDHVLIWVPDPPDSQVIITSRNKVIQVEGGQWIGINKRGIANANKSLIIGE